MKTDNELNIEASLADPNAAGDELARPSGGDGGSGGASVCAAHTNASMGPNAVPDDLQVFVRSLPVREVARQLGLATGTVGRLRKGCWPQHSHKILVAWSQYKGRGGKATNWFLRTVRSGGVVPHGKAVYTAPTLRSREGELVAVARSRQGGLIVQTLDVPLVRIALDRVQA